MPDPAPTTRPDDRDLDVEAIADAVIDELRTRRRNRRPGDDPLWWAAIDIAARFNIRPGGSADSRKRGVRNVLKVVADKLGADADALIASFHGYALAANQDDLIAYWSFRRRMGLSHLAAASETRHSQAAADASGQLLFQPKQ